MDINQLEVMKVFVKLLYTVQELGSKPLESLPSAQLKTVKKLINLAKKLLRDQNMQMCLAQLDREGK